MPDEQQRRSGGTLRRTRRALPILLLALFSTPALSIHSGHIQGKIFDENGKPFEGALVTVMGAEAVGSWECRTDATGFYRIAGLEASRDLTIRIEAEERFPIERSGYRLRDDQTLRLNFRLKPKGVFHTLVIIDPRVPYHRTALAGARETLPPGVRVFEAKRKSTRTIRKLDQILELRPDGILAIGSLSARLAREVVYDIPVVYTMVLDPVREDLRTENMCGVAANGAFSEQLDILEQMAPSVRKVGTLFAPERTGGVVRQLRIEAEEAGYVLEARAVHSPRDVRKELLSLRESGIEALIMLLDPGLWTLDVFHGVRTFAQEHEIIFIVPDGAMVRAGATFSYAPGFMELGAYGGRLLSNIVNRKVTVAEIGVIFPTTRYFSVNPQDIERYRLKLPPSIMRGVPLPGAPRVIIESST